MDLREPDSPFHLKLAKYLPWITAAWVALMAVSLYTGFLNTLIPTTWHGREGFDFFSIPRSFINLMHGESIYFTRACDYGPWATWYPYHPALSVLAGSWLSLFSPWTSFGVFVAFSCCLLWFSGRLFAVRTENPLLKQLSYFFMFCSTAAYLMLWNGQMHVFVVVAVAMVAADLLDLINGGENGDWRGLRPLLAGGLLLSLLTKPVLVPALLALFSVARYRKTMIYCGLLYAAVSAAFIAVPFLNPKAIGLDAIVDVLLYPEHMFAGTRTPDMMLVSYKDMYVHDNAIHWINLRDISSGMDNASFEFFSLQSMFMNMWPGLMKNAARLPLLLLGAGSLLNFAVKGERERALGAFFLLLTALTAFFVSYSRVYEYHYITALATVPAMLLLIYRDGPAFSKTAAAIYCLCAVIIMLPTPYYFFHNPAFGHHTHLFAQQPDRFVVVWLGHRPYEYILPLMRPFRVLPIILMHAAVLYLSFEIIIKGIRTRRG